MRIGIVTTWFERGAAYVSRQIREVLNQKHRTFIYARAGEKYAKGDPRWDDGSVTWQNPRNGLFVGTYVDKRQFCNWLIKNKIELVIFNEQTYFQPVVWCKEMGVKTIAYVDYYNELMVPAYGVFDALICNTKRHYSVFNWHPGAKYVPWGTNLSLFKPLGEGCLVEKDYVTFFISAGVDPARKGADLFIRAFEKSKAKKMIVHTQTPLETKFPEMVGMISRLKTENRLEVVLETIPAPGLFYRGDVYVYPSRIDGIGLTIAEAAASGLAIIVPDNGPMNEFVDETCGALIPVEKLFCRIDGYYWPKCEISVPELTKILDRYAGDFEMVLRQKKAARVFAEKYLNQSENFKKILEMVDSVKVLPLTGELMKKIALCDNRGMKKYEKYIIHQPLKWFIDHYLRKRSL